MMTVERNKITLVDSEVIFVFDWIRILFTLLVSETFLLGFLLILFYIDDQNGIHPSHVHNHEKENSGSLVPPLEEIAE